MQTTPTAIDSTMTRQTETSRVKGSVTARKSFMSVPTHYGFNSSSLEAARKAAIRINVALARSPNVLKIVVTSVSVSGNTAPIQ